MSGLLASPRASANKTIVWALGAGRGRDGLIVAVRAGVYIGLDQRELHELAVRQLDHDARFRGASRAWRAPACPA